MDVLPTGTVSLLFSDIEGSTALLKRLGPAYAEALDGQRRVLRKAWANHAGTELGTEGDSFYVVFPTAEGAVAAAAQGQRDLAGFEWPGGEQVRVRMGIHTGSPKVHDGAYVGMDVHRAARIAGAAHGGQVLLSSATAELVTECLPEQVTVKDLGSHQLKDITNPEHVFQAAIEGLPSDFPPPKTLGTASSLPRPATPLVGRDGELAELAALLSSPQVRQVTLTGPGGSGKTRLAIGVAERLADRFPDGVYFVPLAAVTTADVMWTSIAEVLDVPPEGRIPPGFFDHVAHRTALFVLDNLEQLDGADRVVTELLEHGPQVVVIASSRRPLNVPGEIQHAVPPLELPEEATFTHAERSGAVQMFVQHAKAVKGSFALTATNAADVVTLCQRLDGLPLAIELAAARSKLLSPSALLSRLDKSLDITATGSLSLARQKTLRDTIAWSYDLLNLTQQAFFRRLGVFAGGADLEAIAAVTADALTEADPLDLVADLVDSSLVTILDDADGEPRVGMLETIRAYAMDQLEAAGEHVDVRHRHGQHYVDLAEQLRPLVVGDQYLHARARLEVEHDNFRKALAWDLQRNDSPGGVADGVDLSLRLCSALGGFWDFSGYGSEGLRWLERSIQGAGSDSQPHARCLEWMAFFLGDRLGQFERAYGYATQCVQMWRRLGDSAGLPRALSILARVEVNRGHAAACRPLLQEARTVAQQVGDKQQLRSVLEALAVLEISVGNHEQALELDTEALQIARELQDQRSIAYGQHNVACCLRELGRVEEAAQRLRDLVPLLQGLNDPYFLAGFAGTYAGVLADLNQHHSAVHMLGAADAMRERLDMPRSPTQTAEMAEPIAKTRAALTSQEWDNDYQTGRNLTVEDALTQAHAATADMAV